MPNFVSLVQTVWKMDYEVSHFGFKMMSLQIFCNLLVMIYRHTSKFHISIFNIFFLTEPQNRWFRNKLLFLYSMLTFCDTRNSAACTIVRVDTPLDSLASLRQESHGRPRIELEEFGGTASFYHNQNLQCTAPHDADIPSYSRALRPNGETSTFCLYNMLLAMLTFMTSKTWWDTQEYWKLARGTRLIHIPFHHFLRLKELTGHFAPLVLLLVFRSFLHLCNLYARFASLGRCPQNSKMASLGRTPLSQSGSSWELYPSRGDEPNLF